MGRRLARKGLIPVSSQRTPPGLTLGPVLGRQLLADRLEHHHPPQRSAKSPRSAESHAQCQVLATASRCRRGPRSRSEPGILTPDRGRTRNPWTRDSLSDMAQSPRPWVHAVVPPHPVAAQWAALERESLHDRQTPAAPPKKQHTRRSILPNLSNRRCSVKSVENAETQACGNTRIHPQGRRATTDQVEVSSGAAPGTAVLVASCASPFGLQAEARVWPERWPISRCSPTTASR
jgi:hypothetical protein